MAYRKKHHAKRHHTKRRRSSMRGVGAIKQGTALVKDAVVATGGFIAATFLGKFVPIKNVYAVAGAKVIAAVLTTKFVKGEMGKSLGLGMALSGVMDIGKHSAPNFFAGVGEDPTILISGIDQLGDIPSLGDMDNMSGIDQLGDIATLGDISDEDMY